MENYYLSVWVDAYTKFDRVERQNRGPKHHWMHICIWKHSNKSCSLCEHRRRRCGRKVVACTQIHNRSHSHYLFGAVVAVVSDSFIWLHYLGLLIKIWNDSRNGKMIREWMPEVNVSERIMRISTRDHGHLPVKFDFSAYVMMRSLLSVETCIRFLSRSHALHPVSSLCNWCIQRDNIQSAGQ